MDALRRAFEQSRAIASMAVVVDAIEERAKNFYAEYGFIELPEHPSRLLFPMATIAQMFAG